MQDETWCHIYGPQAWHSPVLIQGTRSALEAIRDAINTALKTGMDSEARPLFSTDGEGYRVHVQIRNRAFLENTDLPYIAPSAGGIGQALLQHEQDASRKADEQVVWSTYYRLRADHQKEADIG